MFICTYLNNKKVHDVFLMEQHPFYKKFTFCTKFFFALWIHYFLVTKTENGNFEK